MESTGQSQIEELRERIASLEATREKIWRFRREAPDELERVKRRLWTARKLALFSLAVSVSLLFRYADPPPFAFIQGAAFALNFGLFFWNIIPAETQYSAIKRMIKESANDLAKCESHLQDLRDGLAELERQ